MTYQDEVYLQLRSAGLSGSLNDMLASNYRTGGAVGGTLNALGMSFLHNEGYTSGTYNDRWASYAKANGLPTGTTMAVGGFSPSSLFKASEVGVWYDPSDFSTLFQDSAGSTPVTTVNQPVGLMLDKSGRGNHAIQATTTNRPTLQQDSNGKYHLKFDGVDDGMVTASINFTATDKVSIFAGIRKLSDAAFGVFVELSASTTINNGAFFISAPSSASDRYSFNSKGTVQVNALRLGYAAPVTSILTCFGNIGADVCRISVNSTSTSTTITDQGTGNYGNYPLYIGRRGGASAPFNGHFYGLVVRGSESTSAEILSTEKWMANKTGVVL